ncbi:MAG TPA: hypothetical protein VGO50_14920 [Pyrinomonadaceae bacterium]|jgi:hypothetical protein|nr:hypothetical protein [Pyrinomonadaceae bacterium]
MLQILKAIFIISVIATAGFAVTDLQKLVDTELAFAKKAADTNTRQAFLDFTADEGVIFNPTVTNAKAFWEKRAVGASWLAWHPTWADVSADGQAGWDIGPWEFHPKGKDDAATAFGSFCTFWVKQPDGNFKFVVDMGIGYEKSGFADREVKFPADAGKGSKTVKDQSHYNSIEKLFYSRSLLLAYTPVLAEDSVLLIDGKAVIRGKKDVLAEFNRQDLAFDPKDSTALEVKSRRVYGNLSYLYGEVATTKADKSVHKQNFLQIWKYRKDKWELVCEVFTDIPK